MALAQAESYGYGNARSGGGTDPGTQKVPGGTMNLLLHSFILVLPPDDNLWLTPLVPEAASREENCLGTPL